MHCHSNINVKYKIEKAILLPISQTLKPISHFSPQGIAKARPRLLTKCEDTKPIHAATHIHIHTYIHIFNCLHSNGNRKHTFAIDDADTSLLSFALGAWVLWRMAAAAATSTWRCCNFKVVKWQWQQSVKMSCHKVLATSLDFVYMNSMQSCVVSTNSLRVGLPTVFTECMSHENIYFFFGLCYFYCKMLHTSKKKI